MKQLSDLTDSVQLISDKFVKYEKDRKAKDELITKLQTQVTELTDKVVFLLYKLTNKQYSRRNCLLIDGIKENRNEDTDTLSISTINEHLGLDIQPSDIDRMHRIGDKNKARRTGRAIIIKFTITILKKKVSWKKKSLKEEIYVTESLTSS